MKNLVRIALVLWLMGVGSLFVFSQQKTTERMFKDFRGMDEVTYLSLSKNLLQFMDFDAENEDKEQASKIRGDLKEVRLVMFKPNKAPKQRFIEKVRHYMRKGGCSRVEDIDSEVDAEVWVQRRGRKVKECHVILQGQQNGVLLSFFGDFKMEDVERMRKKIQDYED
ncbi:protein of unknown function [Saccharicrinis carchari]|uniref:DUF4252 domain-containing protein n=1 Tax=Saccharicrinis carchari TaxID=1168039 RepID=A0A521BZJ1_SACCC|nr:DUF4252 domain-containing protein [Saccharicrinis carchari]SMO52619.1 protein of unknown function [Saccharicrinis carchari]